MQRERDLLVTLGDAEVLKALGVGLMLVCGTILFSFGLVWLAATVIQDVDPHVGLEPDKRRLRRTVSTQ